MSMVVVRNQLHPSRSPSVGNATKPAKTGEQYAMAVAVPTGNQVKQSHQHMRKAQ